MMVMTPSSDLPFHVHVAKDDPKQLLQDEFEAAVEAMRAEIYKKFKARADALKLRIPAFETKLQDDTRSTTADSGSWVVAKRSMFLVFLVMLFAASSVVVTTTEFGRG